MPGATRRIIDQVELFAAENAAKKVLLDAHAAYAAARIRRLLEGGCAWYEAQCIAIAFVRGQSTALAVRSEDVYLWRAAEKRLNEVIEAIALITGAEVVYECFRWGALDKRYLLRCPGGEMVVLRYHRNPRFRDYPGVRMAREGEFARRT